MLTIDDDLRAEIISRPSVILDDKDVMLALIEANESSMGSNIVDLRGIAMERLEARLDRLEDTHRNVIAAAYENLAGTNQVHRAVLRLLEPVDFEGFLRSIGGEVADILRVDSMRLVLESNEDAGNDPAVQRMGDVLLVAPAGFVADYVSGGHAGGVRQVTLRQLAAGDDDVHAERANDIRSEACVVLDLGEDRLPGMVVMGSTDSAQFTQQQGTDLLSFFGGVFERSLRRWLA